MSERVIANLFILEQIDEPVADVPLPRSGCVDDMERFTEQISAGTVRKEIGTIVITGNPEKPVAVKITSDALRALDEETQRQINELMHEADTGIPIVGSRESPEPLTENNAHLLIHTIATRTCIQGKLVLQS